MKLHTSFYWARPCLERQNSNDRSAFVWRNELLWSFTVVHKGATAYSSLPLLQSGSNFTVTSIPVSRSAEWTGTVDTRKPSGDCIAIQYEIAGQYTFVLVVWEASVSSWSSSSPSGSFPLAFLSSTATDEKKDAAPLIFRIASSLSSRFWHIFSRGPRHLLFLMHYKRPLLK